MQSLFFCVRYNPLKSRSQQTGNRWPVNEIREWKEKQATWNRIDVTLKETRRMTQGLNSKGMNLQTSAQGVCFAFGGWKVRLRGRVVLSDSSALILSSWIQWLHYYQRIAEYEKVQRMKVAIYATFLPPVFHICILWRRAALFYRQDRWWERTEFWTGINFNGVHPVVLWHIETNIVLPWNNKLLLNLSVSATCFSLIAWWWSVRPKYATFTDEFC